MKKYTLIISIITLVFISSCGMKSVGGMKNNIDKKSSQIIELKNYFNQVVPPNYVIRIRYNSSNNVDLFVYEPIENSTRIKELFGDWNVNLDKYKENPQTEEEKENHEKTKLLKSVSNKLNWNREIFEELYEKLNKANCIGICNGEPTAIEYGFKGMGLLSFLIFDKNLTSEQQEEFSNDCSQIFYKDNIVLQYDSGAIGSFCIPEFKIKKLIRLNTE